MVDHIAPQCPYQTSPLKMSKLLLSRTTDLLLHKLLGTRTTLICDTTWISHGGQTSHKCKDLMRLVSISNARTLASSANSKSKCLSVQSIFPIVQSDPYSTKSVCPHLSTNFRINQISSPLWIKPLCPFHHLCIPLNWIIVMILYRKLYILPLATKIEHGRNVLSTP